MSKIIKWLFYLIVTGALGLIIFAYLGPFFGFDFTPEEKTIIIPVEILGLQPTQPTRMILMVWLPIVL